MTTARRRISTGLAACVAWLLLPAAAFATGGPNFGSVNWQPLGCDGAVSSPTRARARWTSSATRRTRRPPTPSTPTTSTSATGWTTNPRQFDQFVWTALMQVPSGDRFQYQYQLSLNGKSDTIEIWQNTDGLGHRLPPHFQDDSEVQLYSDAVGSLAASGADDRRRATTTSSTSPSRCRS